MSWEDIVKNKDSKIKTKLEFLLEHLENGPNAEMSVSYAIGYVKGLLKYMEGEKQ